VATTYSSIVLEKLCIPAVNDSEGGGLHSHSQYLISHLLVVLQMTQ